MLRSDYSSDYKGQKPLLRDSIATIVATTPFKNRFEWPKQREGIYKEKKLKFLSSLAPPLAGRQALAASRQERKHRLLVPKGSLQGEP